MNADAVAVHAPYWPLVTLVIGVCIGAADRGSGPVSPVQSSVLPLSGAIQVIAGRSDVSPWIEEHRSKDGDT